MSRASGNGTGASEGKPPASASLFTQLRNPPGGRDARIMLTAQFLDRIGTGVWSAAAVLYFSVEAGFDVRRIGLLLGVGGMAGVIGSPVAGRLAAHRPARSLLIYCHLLRMATLCVILSCTRFYVLLAAVALTAFGDRASKMLEMLFATEVAGPARVTYQALFRSVANTGYAVGAGIAAIGLAVGTRDAYRILILLDALSFAVISLVVRRVNAGSRLPCAATELNNAAIGSSPATAEATIRVAPWRDAGYLRFVLLDVVMTIDDPLITVGLPLWLLTHTSAPHALVPAFLVINTALVVVLQMRISAALKGPRDATKAVIRYGVIILACCALLAAAPACGPLLASFVMLSAAALVTLAELMRSVGSWELAVCLAPPSARPAYLGVAGMSQSVQICIGPLVLTGGVMVAGPVGWLALGGVVAASSILQRRGCIRRLDGSAAASSANQAAPTDVLA